MHAKSFDLFEETSDNVPAEEIPLPDRVRRVIDGIKAMVTERNDDGMLTGLCIPYSGGKDSSCTASIALAALAELAEQGELPDNVTHLVISADTLVENPSVQAHMQRQHRAMRAFAKAHDIPLTVKVVSPSLATRFQVSVLGGRRAMPTFGMVAACSKDWKVATCQAGVRQHLKSQPANTRFVTLLGSRRDEGTRRSNNLDQQGAGGALDLSFHDGHWLGFPVIDMTTTDVFHYLLMATPWGEGGPFPTYCDNQGDVLRLYSSASGGGCALVASDKTAGSLQQCSSRTGCFTCLPSGERDDSLESMVRQDAPHLLPLVRFRAFLKAASESPACRNYIGTAPSAEGKISLGATGYAGWVLLAMVRYLLTIDAEEAERAKRAGEAAAFQVLSLEEVVAIDFLWSQRSLQQRPFEAMRAWQAVHERGERFSLPDIPDDHETLPRLPAQPMPVSGHLHRGGLLGPLARAAGVDAESGDRLSVDLDGAIDFLTFELSRWQDRTEAPEAAARILTQMGIVKVARTRTKEVDMRLNTVGVLRDAGWMDSAFHGGLPVSLGEYASTDLLTLAA